MFVTVISINVGKLSIYLNFLRKGIETNIEDNELLCHAERVLIFLCMISAWKSTLQYCPGKSSPHVREFVIGFLRIGYFDYHELFYF